MSDTNHNPIRTFTGLHTQQQPSTDTAISSSSSLIHIEPHSSDSKHLSRPKLGSCKSSGTNIVPRDDPRVEIQKGEETFDPDDARAISPRRNSKDLEKMAQDAQEELSQHVKNLHESLLKIFNRIEAVKEEHDKLDSNNKFLQNYISVLMSTSKITAAGPSGRKK